MLLSIVGPLIPRTAFAQTVSTPSNPGNSGASIAAAGNTGIQQGQTDLGIPETGPAATLQPTWSVDPSTGAFTASMPFLLPQARGAVQPSLALLYSSTGGQGQGGLGWSLNLPAIERHNPSGLPQYDDPAEGAEINTGTNDAGAAPPEDWFTYGGAALVPVCFVESGGGSCYPIGGGTKEDNNAERMPTWATGGWHYYRLEVETGSNLRFFWSPNHETWVVQEPSGSTMEFGVPQDNPSDTGGIDIDKVATAAEEDAGTGLPAVFRWNLVRHYDAERAPGSSTPPHPTNEIVFSWSKLPLTSPLGGSSTSGLSPISDLTDIYDTPLVATSYLSTQSEGDYAHHTHLSYSTAFNTNSTRVDRARHANYLGGVDVTSATFAGGSSREQVRRYVLSYVQSGHQVALSKVQLDGWCSSGDPTEDSATGLLPLEPSSGPVCGTNGTWAPWTTFTYSTGATFTPSFTPLSPTFNALPPKPPALFDVNSDGLPDLIDTDDSPQAPYPQLVYLNSAPPATTLTLAPPVSLLLGDPGLLDAVPAGMQPYNLNYTSGAFLNGAQVNGVWFDPKWITMNASGQSALSGDADAGVGAQIYSPVAATSSTPGSYPYDWGTPKPLSVTSLFPGCLQNCVTATIDLHPDGVFQYPACAGGQMYLGCDEPFASLDIDGDGLQDLLVSSVYGHGSQVQANILPSGALTPVGTSTYASYLNVKFSTRAPGGVVSPFSAPPPQETRSVNGSNVPCYNGVWCVDGLLSLPGPNPNPNGDAPNFCVGPGPAGVTPGSANTFGDINGDGIPDWITLYADHFSVSYGHGDGVFGVCADGTTECGCAASNPVTFATTGQNEWDFNWSTLGSNVEHNAYSGNVTVPDPYLNAQFHDVDGDGFDDAIVPNPTGFNVFFITTNTGNTSYLPVVVTGPSTVGTNTGPLGFGWGAPIYGDCPLGAGPTCGPNDVAYMFGDMDGSGVDDVVMENPSGAIGYVDVLGGLRPGLLNGIQTGNTATTSPYGAVSTVITYDDLPSLSRQAIASGSPWSLQSPQSIHVVTSVLVTDNSLGSLGTSPPLQMNYKYSNPVYDGRDRTFVGFTTVDAVNASGDSTAPPMHTRTTFYQGYCDPNSQPSYACPTSADYPNHALRGLPLLTETFGTATDTTTNGGSGGMIGPALSTIHRTYQEGPIYAGMDGRNVHRAALGATDTWWYDNTGPVGLTLSTSGTDIVLVAGESVPMQPAISFKTSSASDTMHTYVAYGYDDVWGMSGTRSDYGVVGGSTGTFGGTQTSVDGEIIDFVKASVAPLDTVDYWIWRPSLVTRAGTAPSSTAVVGDRTVSYFYDSRGNPTTETTAYSGGQPMVRSSATMPETADGGAGAPPGAPPTASANGNTIVLATYTVDPGGTGNITNVQQTSTGRCQDIAYDAAFSQLVTAVTTHVNGCSDAGLTAMVGSYARGLGLATETNTPDGQETQIQYEPYGRLQSIQRPSLSTPNFTEGFAGVTVAYADTILPRQVHRTVTDRASNTLETWNVLDGFGRPVMKIATGDSAGTYIVSGQVQRNGRGGISAAYPATTTNQWTEGSSAGTISSLAPSGPARTFTYDAFGRLKTATDINGPQVLGRTYGPLQYIEQDADQLAAGWPSSGTTTTVSFNGHGRVSATLRSGTGSAMVASAITYLPTGEVSSLVRAGVDSAGTNYSYSRSMQYDSLGRMVVNSEPASSWTYAYDDAGDLVATTDGRGCGKNTAYDGAGRISYEDYIGCTSTQLSYSPPNPVSGVGTEVLYEYDSLGHLVDLYDRAAHTHYSYDARARLTSVQRNIVQPTATQPIPAGYAPHTFAQDFIYDDFDRLTGQTTGEENEEGTAALNGAPVPFTSFGSTSTATSASAVLLQYSPRGLLQSIGGSYGSLIQGATYDPNGLPLTTTWGDLASTQTGYSYDGRLRLHERKSSRTAPGLWSGASGGNSYAPPSSLPTSTTTQTVLEDDIYSLDPVGNPTYINDARLEPEWQALPGYEPVSRAIVPDAFYRTASVTYVYEPANSYASPTPSSTPAESPFPLQDATARVGTESSTYDPFGNRTSSSDETGYFFDRSLGTVVNGTSGPLGTVVNGTSGGLSTNQITSATLSGPSGGSLTTNYDAAGNLVRLDVLRDGKCESGVGCNQLFDYEWDEVGRLARARRYDFPGGKMCITFPPKLGGGQHCANNALPTDPDKAWPALPAGQAPDADMTFVYDASGTRVLRASTEYGTTSSTSTTPTYTVDVFPSLRLADTTFGVENTTGDYDRSAETDQVSLVAGGPVLGRVVFSTSDPAVSGNASTSGQHIFLELTDHLGSTTTVIDQATSELVERTTFSTFGRVESDYKPARWASFREPFKFTGKEDDITLGITYFGARWYSPYLGTWISPDPLAIHGLGADLNPYAYVRGRAMSATDPFGLDCEQGSQCGASWAYLVSPLPIPAVATAIGNFFSGIHINIGGGGYSPPPTPTNPGHALTSAKALFLGLQALHQAYSLTEQSTPHPIADWINRPDPFSSGDRIGPTGGMLIAGLAANAGFSMVDDAVAAVTGEGATTGSASAFGGCFGAGTPIATDRGWVTIEAIREGTLVWTRDPQSGELELRPVIRTFVHEDDRMLAVTLNEPEGRREVLHVTTGHPFWVAGRGWVLAGELTAGDPLTSPTSTSVTVASVERLQRAEVVYNFEVEVDHSYFVGFADVWVHNQSLSGASGGYRVAFNASLREAGIPELPAEWDAHHAIPQELIGDPRVPDGFDFDAPENIRGVEGARAEENVHQEITNLWREYLDTKPNATWSDINEFRDVIDSVYGDRFWGW